MATKMKVAEIIDGDTFKTEGGQYIRLANVDAPEKGQHGAPEARDALKKLIGGKEVSVEKVAMDRGRIVANVKVDGRSVNKAMNEKLKK